MPPTVAASSFPSGGPSGSIWSSAAKAACACASGTPASSTAVRSPTLCSRIRAIPAVSTSTTVGSPRPPQSSFVPPPRGRSGLRASPSERSSSAASSGEPGRSRVTSAVAKASEPLGEPGGFQRVDPVRARHLAAQPRRRHHLGRVGEPRGVERAAQALERGQVGLVEHLRHVLLLVDADPVLAGDRAARLEAGVENKTRELFRALGLALLAAVVADERVEVA